jgi:hypothetical protein
VMLAIWRWPFRWPFSPATVRACTLTYTPYSVPQCDEKCGADYPPGGATADPGRGLYICCPKAYPNPKLVNDTYYCSK